MDSDTEAESFTNGNESRPKKSMMRTATRETQDQSLARRQRRRRQFRTPDLLSKLASFVFTPAELEPFVAGQQAFEASIIELAELADCVPKDPIGCVRENPVPKQSPPWRPNWGYIYKFCSDQGGNSRKKNRTQYQDAKISALRYGSEWHKEKCRRAQLYQTGWPLLFKAAIGNPNLFPAWRQTLVQIRQFDKNSE